MFPKTKGWISIFIVIFSLFVQANTAVKAESFPAQVVAVMDGDTIEVLRGAKSIKIRLANIDCPEKSQEFGQRAKQYTSEFVFGKLVLIDSDKMDKYGRLIAEVSLPGGSNLNRELVSHGMAWCYLKYCKDDSYLTLEQLAREARVGLWAHSTPIAPWEFRKSKKRQSKNRQPKTQLTF